jgi:hypothetical protein
MWDPNEDEVDHDRDCDIPEDEEDEDLDCSDSRWDDDLYDEENRIDFADPGGNSALRAATPSNPRNLPCPNCGKPNRLTPADRARGYQCDECADRAERGGDY